MLHTTNPVIQHKADLLNLAEELINVSKVCKIMGVSRDKFGGSLMVRKMNHRFENFLTMNSSVNNAVMMRHRERYSHKMLFWTCF